MTAEEAIKIIEKRISSINNSLQRYEDFAPDKVLTMLLEERQGYQMAIEALEKQISKKLVQDKWGHNCCPSCGWFVSGYTGYGEEFSPHCENCGQAILWEDEE